MPMPAVVPMTAPAIAMRLRMCHLQATMMVPSATRTSAVPPETDGPAARIDGEGQ